jgi:NADH dehydrogenase FAD-containing subunit
MGTSNSKPAVSPERIHIVIIGGSYSGIKTARALIKKLGLSIFITIIVEASHFYHSIGAALAVVSPTYATKSFIPYDSFLDPTQGKIVKGRVSKVHDSIATLSDGSNILFDYLVIATGASYGIPFKAGGLEPENALAALYGNNMMDSLELNKCVEKCQTIRVVGGGPAGIETAAEIKFTLGQLVLKLLAKSRPSIHRNQYF